MSANEFDVISFTSMIHGLTYIVALSHLCVVVNKVIVQGCKTTNDVIS